MSEIKNPSRLGASLKHAGQVNALRKRIKQLRADEELTKLQNIINNNGRLDTLGGISLYFDHVEQSNKVITFTSPIEVSLQTSGDVYSTSSTSGGGARPTLTRVATGGLLLGPLGMLGGAMAQKHGKIKTETTVHDDRIININISGDGGYINGSMPFSMDSYARNFVTTMLNASYDHQKHKITPSVYMDELSKRLADLRNRIGLTQKEDELKQLQEKRLADKEKWQEESAQRAEERKQIREANKETKKKQYALEATKRNKALEISGQATEKESALRETERAKALEAKMLVTEKESTLRKVERAKVLEEKRHALEVKKRTKAQAQEAKRLAKEEERKHPKPFYKRVWFLILILMFVTPVGVFLWFRYFKHPHIAIKIIVSILWLFWWCIFTVAAIQVSTGHTSTNSTNTASLIEK